MKTKNLPNRCATILLQQSVPVHRIAQKVDELLSRCEEAEIVTIENEASLGKQKSALVDLAAKHKIDLYMVRLRARARVKLSLAGLVRNP